VARRAGALHRGRFGARNVDTILNGTLLPEIAEAVLARWRRAAAIGRIKVGATKGGKIKYAVEPA
jgi:type VI secretion system protein VasG